MALVQKNGGSGSLIASVVTSLPGATTAGNTILIFANGAATFTTPAGFTSRSPQVNIQGFYLYEKLVASGNATDTPTLALAGAYNSTWQIVEYSGLTAFVTSNGNNAALGARSTWLSASITPSAGSRRLVVGVAATNGSTTGTFTAGCPSGWTGTFTGQQSNARPGAASPAGNDSMIGGFADQLVTANGSTAYSSTATITSSSGQSAPASIIAAYTETAGGGTKALPPFGMQRKFFTRRINR